MAALAFAIALGIGYLFGSSAEGPLMIAAGSLCIAIDILLSLEAAGAPLVQAQFRWRPFLHPDLDPWNPLGGARVCLHGPGARIAVHLG